MKLYIMKKDALEILKSNLDHVYNLYYTENDNKWMSQVCGGDPFEQFCEVDNFNLYELYEDVSLGKVDFENCKILYKNLSFLSESNASDERLWAGLCNSVFYGYLRQRWEYDIKRPKIPNTSISNIKSRFFFSGGTRSGIYRNSLAKYWWVGRHTYDPTKINEYEKLDIIGWNDISTKINEIFYNNNFSSNKNILNGIIGAIKDLKEDNINLSSKIHIRPALKMLNAVGGNTVLDCLSKEDIKNILVDFIYGINQGDALDIDYQEFTTNKSEIIENNKNNKDNKDIYVSLGQKIRIKIKETREYKIISINYLPKKVEFPPLVKKLIGKKVGDSVIWNNKTCIIEEILSI